MMDARAVGDAVFKIDRFLVPAAAREPFLARTRAIRDFLDTLDGCTQNLLLEQPAGPDASHVVTIVEWRDADAFEAARAAAVARYRATGFSPQEFIARHGIAAEIGQYGLLG